MSTRPSKKLLTTINSYDIVTQLLKAVREELPIANLKNVTGGKEGQTRSKPATKAIMAIKTRNSIFLMFDINAFKASYFFGDKLSHLCYLLGG